jgi:lysyl-tRNA synthetase, class I
MAHMPFTILSDDRVTSQVGSVGEDPFGRLIHQTKFHLQTSTNWLGWAMDGAIEKHKLTAGHFLAWINRGDLYDDISLLQDGVTAWQDGDLVKALHVLIPQIEHGLRSILGKLGKPTTKPHPKVAGVSLAMNMGDILYDSEIAVKLGVMGPNVVLYLLALYADPRGFNLRNEFAHGLLRPEEINPGLLLWLMHTLLVFGAWRLPGS